MDKKYSYQQRMGTFLPRHIPAQVVSKKNKDRSWKYGYNEEYDMIIVSKDGTISQPYELQNIKICTPAVPENVEDIIGHDLDRDDQMWTPFHIPEELIKVEDETVSWNSDRANRDNLKTPTEIFFEKPESFVNKYLPLIDADFNRRDKGLWVYICGKPEWIGGSQYFQLQHVPVQGKRLPDFRFTDVDYWLFWEACKADVRCLGMIYLKNRRSGASTKGGSEQINIGTSISEGFVTVMSKTNRDSVSFLNKMVIRPFKKLVWYFKPVTSGTSSAASGLSFREPAKKMSSKNTVMTSEGGLDTSIKQFPTSINSQDGEKVDFMVLDETGKYPADVPFDQYWSIAEECLVEGFKIVGKAMVVSTVNSQAKGGKGFKDIYYGSDARKRMENGRTSTGLYSLFIPAEWNQEGGYDKFGYSIVEDPIIKINNRDGDPVKMGNLNKLIEKGDALKKQSATLYNEYLRKHPRTEQHAFRDESSVSDFNLNKIYEQMDYNEMQDDIIERGNFVNNGDWEKPDIEWIPSKSGRFYVSWLPKEEYRNKFTRRGGHLHPDNDYGMLAVDTYKVQKTVDRRGGSKGAMSGEAEVSMNLEDFPFPNREFFLEYLERPLTLESFFQDMCYAMLYLGIPAMIENNVPNLLEYMHRHMMSGFAVRRTDKLNLTPDERMYGGVPMTSDKIRNEHYFGIQKHIEHHVGIDDEGKYRDKGQMGNMPFNRTLDSWSKFTPENRTSEDLSISSGLCELGFKMRNNRIKPKGMDKQFTKGFWGEELDYSKGNFGY